jgi:Co/Zn/Cd efflux system component
VDENKNISIIIEKYSRTDSESTREIQITIFARRIAHCRKTYLNKYFPIILLVSVCQSCLYTQTREALIQASGFKRVPDQHTDTQHTHGHILSLSLSLSLSHTHTHSLSLSQAHTYGLSAP